MSEEDMLVEKELAVRRRLGKMYGNMHVKLWNRLRWWWCVWCVCSARGGGKAAAPSRARG